MIPRVNVLMLVVCFLLVSCGTTTQSEKSVFVMKKPIFQSKDGSDIVLQGPAPDGQKVKVIIPDGHGFASAKLLEFNTDEPLMVNVNKWLNKLFSTDAIEYVDTQWFVHPLINDDGNSFYMSEDDIHKANAQLNARGFKMNIFSSDRGLQFSK